MAQRSSRKRRKERKRSEAAADGAMARGYARGRAKDDAVRATLVPLEKGERPTAVTVGAIVAALLAVGNLVALVLSYDPDEPNKTFGTIVATVILVMVFYGMWRARYWAVLGMQTLLAITIIACSLALMFAGDVWGAVLALVLIVGAGALFWFLVKAMARIQMPERPR